LGAFEKRKIPSPLGNQITLIQTVTKLSFQFQNKQTSLSLFLHISMMGCLYLKIDMHSNGRNTAQGFVGPEVYF